MIKRIKEKIDKNLLLKNAILTYRVSRLKKEINELEKEAVAFKSEIKYLKDLNYEINCNYNFLIEQRKKTNRKLKQLRDENVELKEGKEKNERENKKSTRVSKK